MNRILIMGLPGAGKTTLAKKLSSLLNASWLNADEIRKKYNDWDFSLEGRERQAKRMFDLAEKLNKEGKIVIADFVCPLPNLRTKFKPDFLIWMDTIKKGRFEDTNQMFIPPKDYNVRVTEKNAEKWSKKIIENLKKEFDIKKSMREKISVLMTVYNAEKFIKESVQSILSQSYKNLELLIIDDCSTDKSLQLIKKFKDKRIRLFALKQHIGRTKSLNYGLKKIKMVL